MVSTLIEELRDARKHWPFIDDIEKNQALPPRQLYAVGWRETKLQNVVGEFSQRPLLDPTAA